MASRHSHRSTNRWMPLWRSEIISGTLNRLEVRGGLAAFSYQPSHSPMAPLPFHSCFHIRNPKNKNTLSRP